MLAIAGAAALGATSVLVSTVDVKTILAEAALLANEGWIMSGTGVPDPTVGDYMSQVENLYLQPFSTYDFHGLLTPEEFCPPICFPGPPGHPEWTNLNFGDSLNVGAQQLDDAIVPQLENGDNVVVFGYSQSAVIATMEMQNLIENPPGGDFDPSNLHVVVIGSPNNPIGGMLDRFDFPNGLDGEPQHLPFLNVPLSIGPTPTDAFATDVYTATYDGWANFPADPTNLLAVINALVGVQTVHGLYPHPGTTLDIDNIVDLGTIGETHFYSIPAPLPLLAFLHDAGPAGQFFYDAFAPGMALGINWAYGNPGDPFVGVNGTDAIGPWQVNASGELVESDVFGFFPKMDPLQMLAGMQYAGVQSFVGPINVLLDEAGQSPIPQSVVDSMLSGYNFTNELDQLLLNSWSDLAESLNLSDILGPDAIFDGAPLISGEPLLALIGFGFDIFNFFGA
ncbi:PE-PPE domain-containing protein [Mycobacterium shimoidei]|uniref:PPE family protein PPE28 [Mycobacterium tuberculosis H37Rv] n=1 Tax=Mycobacterium shimoidei TaxID=29313 RepID=A0A375YSF4_MYCSH|nr:PE-PPE domain-containing protein [Mycobacterium shimoidei]SRX91834.1 PPE family protein PPE28 [Mycobacterium tuberculosis H37Rv] [Mycobacterium shimoidei]